MNALMLSMNACLRGSIFFLFNSVTSMTTGCAGGETI